VKCLRFTVGFPLFCCTGFLSNLRYEHCGGSTVTRYMSQSNNTKLQPAYSAYKIATFPSNLLEHILSEVYNLCDPYFDIVEKESTKFVKAVSLELTTLFVTGSSLFLTEDISPKFNLSRDYKTYLKDNLHPDLGIHSDAINYYVNDRMSLFLSEILALNKDENLHDITFLSALFNKMATDRGGCYKNGDTEL
jgi:hypothetical protein